MQISAMWNHKIDFNLIYSILKDTQGKIDQTIKCLSMFETWKLQPNNIKKYKNNKKNSLKDVAATTKLTYFVFLLQKKDIQDLLPLNGQHLLLSTMAYYLLKKIINKNL
ncbi:hypothetical protein RFI_01755 [Reticulomyxa filosa]|uniref:Uncharacterized protein n=1 Tax=Reticulomyxa filosa TaxID=46433 RepID=X6PB04_RETFI|nr:hypothetical protein RFI_01755 [Reticulomyxa filosa]|eukprot:ETO35308.1 hypothetical protein RFI_01755 [Reticulomyxa filosa]